MDFSGLSDERILAEIGHRLQRERLAQNLTQADLADRSGIGLRTLAKAEGGKVTTIATLIATLRGLGVLNQLDQFLPPPSPSPVQLAKWKGKQRKRASQPRGNKNKTGDAWSWGE